VWGIGLRIFLNKPFQRFVRKEGIADADLCEAIARADRGLVDADLGGGVIKQRLARPGQGRSGGFRSIILYRQGDRSFFVYGYPKNVRDNITDEELKAFRDYATLVLDYTDTELEEAVANEKLREVECDGENV
jgi:hypothetical protein